MYFSSWQALWEMSGHGPYVWSAYAISFFVLITLLVYPLHKQRQVLKAIKLRHQHQEATHGNAS